MRTMKSFTPRDNVCHSQNMFVNMFVVPIKDCMNVNSFVYAKC